MTSSSRSAPRLRLPSRRRFALHLVRNGAGAVVFVGGSLFLGACGYHWFGLLGWLDAFVNASMILTGMGPLAPMDSVPAKLFVIGYTLYSALTFLTVAALLFGPMAARLMHRLHLDLYGPPSEPG
ncbi:MAG: hypothetical protein AB7L66_18210 [Gemmatimonadales bacterium]